jgi:transposase
MYALWCRKAVQELIYIMFGVFLSLNSISKMMKRRNFVLRRPEKFSILRDDAKIEAYEKGFEEFVKATNKAGATLIWGDETHGQQDSTHSRGYSPKGRAARVLDFVATSSHRVFSLFIALTFHGEMIFTLETENSKAPTFIRFLKELKKHIKGKIYLIVDNASIHHAKIVKQYIGSQRKIRLFYLPPYAPDINPVELFNNTIKTHLRSLPAMTKDELIEYTNKYMQAKMEDNELMRSFFNAKRLKYIKDAMEVA